MSGKINKMLITASIISTGVFSIAVFPNSNLLGSVATLGVQATPPVHQPPITPDYTRNPTKEPTKPPQTDPAQ